MSGIRRLSDVALSGAAAGAVAGQVPVLAASGHYSPGGLPAYNPALQVYNLNDSSMFLWNLAYAKQRNGGGQAKILCQGDSITGGPTGITGDVWLNSWPGRLRAYLATRTGADAGSGWVSPKVGTPTSGFRPTTAYSLGIASTFVNDAGGGPILSLPYSNTVGQTYTVTWTGAGTLRVWTNNGAGSAGSSTTTVDGSASTSIAHTTTNGVAFSDFTVAGAGAHTLVITISTGQLNLIGVEFITAATSGVRVTNFGVSGKLADWATAQGSIGKDGTGPSATAYAPDLTIIMFGTNDSIAGVSVATYKSNIQAAVTQALLSGSALLVTPPRTTTTDVTSRDLMDAALYQISDATGVPVLNLRKRYATNPGAYMDSLGHPTNTTAYDMAAAVLDVVTAQCGP